MSILLVETAVAKETMIPFHLAMFAHAALLSNRWVDFLKKGTETFLNVQSQS